MNTADHDTAMKLAEFGDADAGRGDEVNARGWYRLAYRMERKVADALVGSIDLEPTRSIIHRSAASLAMQIGNFDECEDLIRRGLSGKPPQEIADELRELGKQLAKRRRPASM